MRFTVAVWLTSRLVVLAVLSYGAPHGLTAALGNWDGAWYGEIARHGYAYASDNRPHDAAFFPLYPLLMSLLMRAGIAWQMAGTLIDAVAFLLALLVVERFVRRRYDRRTARWIVVLLCALPLSLFCTVVYSEGLFLLWSALALEAFERRAFVAAGFWSACASATRPLGVALAVALMAAAALRRYGARAVSACGFGLAGIAAFSAYCLWRFGDALAFVHAQVAWRRQTGFDAAGWFAIVRGALEGRMENWFALLLLAFALLGVTVFRTEIGDAGLVYIATSLLLLAAAGEPLSLDRNLYAVIPVALSGAILARRNPVAGFVITGASLVALAIDALAFSRFQWVA